MKPSSFEYLRPDSIEGVVAALAAHGERAKLLAGGQSLIPMMNFRMAAPEVLVDIGRIEGLSGITEGESGLRIGATTRHREVLASEAVRRRCPLLAAGYGHVAHHTVRNRGTIGGNVCHHDPASEVPLVLVLLGAEMTLAGPEGQRGVSAEDFFVDMMETACGADEVLTHISVPHQAEDEGWAFHEMSNRKGDYAMACAAARLRVVDGGFADVRLGFNGAGAATKRMAEVEAMLEGQPASDETIAAAAARAAELADPVEDAMADVAYKRDLIAALGRRALTEARDRATAG